MERLEAMRRGPDVPRFSVGTSRLAAGADSEAAIQAADEAMYQHKAGRRAPALS